MKTISDGFVARTGCPKCKESRSVTCSRAGLRGEGPVTVWAIECNHSWNISGKEKLKLRKELASVELEGGR